MPRSVRYAGSNISSENIKYSANHKENTKKDSLKDKDLSDIEKFAEMIEKNKNNNIDQAAVQNSNSTHNGSEVIAGNAKNEIQLPSLSSQIEKISQKQNETDEKVVLMQSQLDDIKTELSQIKQAIMDLDQNKDHEYAKGQPAKQSSPEPVQKEAFTIKADNYVKPVKRDKPQDQDIIVQSDVSVQANEELQAGKDAFSSKKYDEAITKLEEIVETLKSQDERGEAHFYLGESYFATSNYISAITHYKKVIEIERAKQKDKAQSQIAESYIKKGDINSAITAYSQLIKNYPKSRYIPKAKKMLQQL